MRPRRAFLVLPSPTSALSGVALIGALLSLGACPSGLTGEVRGRLARADALVAQGSPHTAIAGLLAGALDLLPQSPRQAGPLLARAFALRPQLLDDRALRDALARWPLAAVPSALRPARALGDAQERFSAGTLPSGPGTLRAVGDIGAQARAVGDTLTAARANLLLGLLAAAQDPTAADRPEEGVALAALARVTRAPLQGLQGASLKALAWLTLGGLHYDARHMGRAIRAYLRVGRKSGRWRAARLAMAWCQFRLQRPASAHAILAQLPGGPAATTESALLDALALHALGELAAARAVIDAALTHAARWRAERTTPEAVLAAAAAAAEQPSLDAEPPRTLARLVATSQPVWSLAREVLATDRSLQRAAPGDRPALARYRALVWEAFARAARAATEDMVAGAERGVADLTTLRPQIRPLTPATPEAPPGPDGGSAVP